MTLYDISVPLRPPIQGTHVYPGDVPFSVTRVKTVHKDGVNLSQMEIGSHNGTHIDVPAHLFDGGMVTEGFPLDYLVGPAWVADCTDVTEGEAITLDRLNALGIEGSPERILFKTRNSNLWKRDNFQMRYVYLGVDAARALAERGVKAVGIDYLSVDRYGAPELETHAVLMGAGTIIIEGIDLSGVEADRAYDLACLPLKIAGLDGAPARAVLRD